MLSFKMSDSSSETDSASISDNNLEYNFIPGNYLPIKSELDINSDNDSAKKDDGFGVEAYSTEPLADDNWLVEYNK